MTEEEVDFEDLQKAKYLIERGYTYLPLDEVFQRIREERLKREKNENV